MIRPENFADIFEITVDPEDPLSGQNFYWVLWPQTEAKNMLKLFNDNFHPN